MIIHLSLNFDGMQPAWPAGKLGEVWLGPSAFLNVLETQLGLPPVKVRPGEALLAYRGCLADVDDGSRFYSRSLAVDPMGVARTLLRWRSEWYAAGWTGQFANTVSQRLADMALVETHARDRVPLVSGQRLQRVTAALRSRRTQIERVILHDTLDELPAGWRGLLSHFDAAEADGVVPSPSAAPNTDLSRVQVTLESLAVNDRRLQAPPQLLSADGTFIVVRGVSRDLSAQAIAELALTDRGLGDVVLIAERDGIILDNAMERVGLPRCGYQHYSQFRSVTQFLRLALGLLWDPVSPRLLLQFLVHPVGPLPRFARNRLAEAVSAEPGVGGRAWAEALSQIESIQRGKLDADEAAVQTLRDGIALWLECERHAPEVGAPLSTLVARTQACASWLVSRLATLQRASEKTLFGKAIGQAEGLLSGLARLHDQGAVTLSRVELDRLIDEVTGDSADPETFAEAKHIRAATDPATVTQPWDTVIWWDLAFRAADVSSPWSRTELGELERNGVALPSLDERLRQRTRRWLRPILNARERFILVVHETDEGHHPLWNQLTSVFEDILQLQLDDSLLSGSSGSRRHRVPLLELPTRPLAVTPLPAPKRWWQLPADVRLPRRAVESYSSLEKLVDHPYQWVLQYPARLRPGRAADIAGGGLLYGNLAHHLFEDFFKQHPNWAALSVETVSQWVQAQLKELVYREGATLHGPGQGVRRAWVMATVENAFMRLLNHLKRANVVHVDPEHEVRAPFRDLELRGGIDLLLADAEGRETVLDVKWGGEKPRGEQLQANRQLQLATYGFLRRAHSHEQRWPAFAYFIIQTGNVLAQDTDTFPDAVPFEPETAGGNAVLWRQLQATLDWRWQQFDEGRIEVSVAGTEPTFGSVPPEESLAPKEGPAYFDDFAWLTGWESGA